MSPFLLRRWLAGVIACLSVAISGCASDGPNREPAALQPYEALVSVAQVWKTPLDGAVGDALRLSAHDRFVAAASGLIARPCARYFRQTFGEAGVLQ
jgi:hypothetical protein